MSRVERGLANPSLDAIAVFAVALKVEVSELFKKSSTTLPPVKAAPATIMVPYAADGSCFNPSLRRPKTGKYTVGLKGKNVTFNDFNAALEYLKGMGIAHWLRPNGTGNWGRVVAVRWDTLPKKYR